MFGYIVANIQDLTPAQQARYRACYCGLCRCIKERCGQLARSALTYDMTFLVLVLSSLYEPESATGEERCLIHPLKAHPYWQNSVTQYAADLNTALAYYKCLDDWQDERAVLKLGEAKLLERAMTRIRKDWPRPCAAIETGIRNLSQIEAGALLDPDAAANCFGQLMGQLFILQDDVWSDTLKGMGAALGRFIYLMDAYVDLPGDRKAGRFNPLMDMAKEPDFEAQCRDVLTMMIGECAMELERLPLVQDIDLIRNIVYSGVWTNYYAQPNQRRGGKENT